MFYSIEKKKNECVLKRERRSIEQNLFKRERNNGILMKILKPREENDKGYTYVYTYNGYFNN